MEQEEDKTEDDPVTMAEYSETVQYALIAAAETEPFSADTALTILGGVEPLYDDIAAKDYAGAVPACEERFGIANEGAPPAIPEDDTEALFACMAISAFMGGDEADASGDLGGEDAQYRAFLERLDTLASNDVDALSVFARGDGEAAIQDGLKEAFSKGDPAGYIAECEKRFPEG